MKKLLQKITTTELYFRKNGVKQVVDGRNKDTYPSGLTGDISELTGDISGLTGDISGLTGNISELTGNISSRLTGNISELTGNISSRLTGNISGVYGDATNISGDLDECKITEEEREKGINIEDLVG